MTVGLVIGSVLAQETSLGAAYFQDPKVIASFLMWFVYVLLIFIRQAAGLRGRRAAYVSGAVFIVMLAVFAANAFSHVHRFGARYDYPHRHQPQDRAHRAPRAHRHQPR